MKTKITTVALGLTLLLAACGNNTETTTTQTDSTTVQVDSIKIVKNDTTKVDTVTVK